MEPKEALELNDEQLHDLFTKLLKKKPRDTNTRNWHFNGHQNTAYYRDFERSRKRRSNLYRHIKLYQEYLLLITTQPNRNLRTKTLTIAVDSLFHTVFASHISMLINCNRV